MHCRKPRAILAHTRSAFVPLNWCWSAMWSIICLAIYLSRILICNLYFLTCHYYYLYGCVCVNVRRSNGISCFWTMVCRSLCHHKSLERSHTVRIADLSSWPASFWRLESVFYHNVVVSIHWISSHHNWLYPYAVVVVVDVDFGSIVVAVVGVGDGDDCVVALPN